ncbi:NHL repeat-containing protein [Aaosphaeria arxii CBS 175.79]|uniref:NHL repeat-containing protein n=1 Tax=Aaosphaeria arxii CBS 175.79 TaxID=1450172 RepID=A0A6A5XX35_9PLEO|nr:NHL repeat-containing protein [Aaosphaeria arxii CBS 175.79]KAF2017200.1 NHL repeat-containing protein [Aaosphaeria arxii CBS 175.79]
MRCSYILGLITTASSIAFAATLNFRQSATTEVYKFPGPPAWAEGIAARSTGQLLVSFFDGGELWSLDPTTKNASKVATFPDATCTGGITEIAPDVFAVVAGKFTFAGGNTAGSWGIWKVDFSTGAPKTSLLKKVPESRFFNGLTTLNNDTILIGDAEKGAVWRMNVNTGNYSIAIQDETMVPVPGAAAAMGIDGLRYSNGVLYFTNVFGNRFHKVAVDTSGAKAGTIDTIWSDTTADDLWVTPDGTSYVATGGSNKIQKVTSDGKISTIASVSSSTAVTLGRGQADRDTLYISTGSGSIFSVKV